MSHQFHEFKTFKVTVAIKPSLLLSNSSDRMERPLDGDIIKHSFLITHKNFCFSGDEYYWKLISDFIGPQTGEGLELEKTPCKNRVLIQVGLMKEVNNSPWSAILEWLKKIFPRNQSADFRRLIETGIATTLSLGSDARLSFLESHVNFNYVGPICDSIGVEREHLLDMRDFSDQAQSIEVTNELILELDNFITREQIGPVVIVTWLRNFNPEFCQNGDVQKAYRDLRFRIKKLKQLHHSCYERRGRRRNPTIEHLLQSPFELVKSKTGHGLGVKKRMKKCTLYSKKVIKEEFDEHEIKHNSESEMNMRETREKSSCDGSGQDLDVPCNGDEAQGNRGEQLTLLDIAMLSIQKLSSVYGGKSEACKQVSMELLKNQYNLTCKENPGMTQFEETLQSCEGISLASPVKFLHHNAHFLVDVQDAVEQQMMSFEKELIEASGEKLGRDKNPKFAKFVNFSESATSRYIHMVRDVLSPHAHDKFNYRRYWVAFCEEKENPSRIAVNLSNRFNNYFEAAAGLIHHHKEIALFFSDLLALNTDGCPNIILESVAEDASDPVMQSLVCVLAIIYCKVLGPYWQLLKSAGEYSHFGQYILSLYQRFLDWSKDPSTLLEPEETTNVFLQYPLQEKTFDRVFEYCGLWHTNRDLIKAYLRRMVKVIAAVTEENLKDFLPGGIYSQNPSSDVSLNLSQCTFAVLMGGYPFGHAYPYRKRRPDKSSQQTSFSYLPSVSSDEADALSDSPDNPNSSDCYQSSTGNREVARAGKRRRDSDQINPEDKRMDRDYIMATVERNGGPCRTQQDVDKLLLRFEGKPRAEKWEAVRCELLYQNIVLSNDDADLEVVGKSTSEMAIQLKLSLPRVKPSFSFVIAPKLTKEKKKGPSGQGESSST